MKLFKLSKIVLRITDNPAQFLNGLTSNSFDKPQNAFLNIHGRIIAVFDQIKINDNEFWIAVESAFVDGLLKHVDKYAKLSNVQIEHLQKYVYYDLESAGPASLETQCVIPQKKGRLVISDVELEANVPEEAFLLFRLNNHIPIQGVDYTDEFVLNVGEKELVSFEKGCFLGQEPVSKVHNRSSPTWQLVVKYEDECDEETKQKMTSKAFDPAVKRTRGFVFINNK